MKLKFLFLIAFSFLLCGSLHAQNKNNKKIIVSGIVTNENRNPVAGAMILVDKKNTNKVTDSKGFYKIKVRSDANTISVFTFKGESTDVLINNRTTINITMGGSQNNSQNLRKEGERVEIGYGSVEKEDLTNQVSKLEVNRNKYSSYSDIYDALRGTVPGLQVRGKSITIQGISSNNPNSEPLYVVDGMIVSSIDYITPTEIKSIEVLKGAAASIYGSRGANGVLLINLIRGPEKK